MPLPKQVQRTIDEVEALEKQMQAPANEESEDTETPKMEVVSEQTTDANTTDDEEVEYVDAEEDDEETATQPEVSAEAEATWEHKYKRLQGKYDAEVPRLHDQIKYLNAQMAELQKAQQKAAQATDSAKQEAKIEPLVTDADIEEYGEDLVNLARRIAKDTIREDMAAIKAENAKLREQLELTGSQVGEMGFEAKLNRLIPDFADINNDPAWSDWLNVVDPFLGVPRRAIAQEAFNKGDAETVARFVQVFRSEVDPQVPTRPDRKAEVKRQIQPAKAAAPTAPTSQKGRTYTRADVDSMFRKVTEYSSKQQHEKAKKLEAEIDAAFREGRVQV